MTDIQERLRYGKDVESWWELGAEAADTIDTLLKRIEVLEEERLFFKRQWSQEAERAEKLASELAALDEGTKHGV